MRVVSVVGPPLSGATAVAAAVRARLPGVSVVEAGESGPVPDVVIGVLSAVAPASRADWTRVERVADAAPVVGVVSKIDAHRGWRDVLAANRRSVSAWDAGGRAIPWVGVAAAPDLGEPCVGELVDVLRELLAEKRNSVQGAGFRPACRPRQASLETRAVDQRTRLRLLELVRDRCTSWRAEARETASGVGFGSAGQYEATVRAGAQRLLAELDEEITAATGVPRPDAAAGRWPEVDRPPASRPLEGRLMTVLGVGFGLGVALAASRLLAGLAPGLAVPGMLAGAALGAALMTWVVRARRVLHDRALLDRWVTEVASTLRWRGEAMVAERLLAARSERRHEAAGGGFVSPDRPLDEALEEVTDQYRW